MIEYDEESVLFQYVRRFRRDFMTELELRADRAYIARAKAAATTNRTLAKELLDRMGEIDDAEVNALLACGGGAFRQQLFRRIMTDPTFLAAINRCPKCRRIVRTPKAKQCMWCGHDWH